jgi:hypothetical protein
MKVIIAKIYLGLVAVSAYVGIGFLGLVKNVAPAAITFGLINFAIFAASIAIAAEIINKEP